MCNVIIMLLCIILFLENAKMGIFTSKLSYEIYKTQLSCKNIFLRVFAKIGVTLSKGCKSFLHRQLNKLPCLYCEREEVVSSNISNDANCRHLVANV